MIIKLQDSNEMENIHERMSETPDDSRCFLDYTNRRKIEHSTQNHNNSEEQRKKNEEEFEYIQLQLEEFSVSNGSSKKSLRMNSGLTSSKGTSRHPEVEAFQKFLDSEGGHYGGWKEKDHLFFLSTRKKYPLNKVAQIVHDNFPDISVEKALKHEIWFNEYLKLKAAKKRAIEDWKKSHKAAVKSEEKINAEPSPQIDLKTQPKRDPNLKEKIEIWKAHCFATKLERKEMEKKEEIRKKKEESDSKKLQEEKRALVNRYREEKLSLEYALKEAKETEALEAKREAAIKAANLLKYFRYEDRRFTERQIAKRQPKVKPEPRVKSAIEVRRDPNRLLQPTLGWIHHTQRNRETDKDANTITSLDLTHLPRLKKPAWRKGLTSP